ncbi:MAG: hypothetical protein IPM46_10830 [Flavobacteriales bacterium]|nr:hypothetical protein [Flavobacteriales bacterium]
MRSIILLLTTATFLVACGPANRSRSAATVTREQFQEIQWIVGKWRGAEAGGAPFFESYSMLDDSTLGVASFSDSAFTNLAGIPSVISLRGGQVTNGSAIATEWDATSVRFDPDNAASNSYAWRKETADQWTARLFWKDKQGEARERIYFMTRIAE